MPSQFLPQARTAHLIVQTLDDEILLFDSVADRAHVLNQTSAVVWKLANGKRTVEQLSQLTARELHAQPDTDLIWLALTQLSKANLLEQPATVVPLTAQLNRREFLQKAAMAAVIIPTVKTVSGPTVQQSVSCVQPGGSCQTTGDCCTPDLCIDNSCTCFTAGTLVWYSDGTQRAIETVALNDMVLARDEQTGLVAPQRVEKTYIHHNRAAFTLDFGASQIETTATHPFFTDTGWVKAIDLRAGMDCYLSVGARLTVQAVKHPLPHPTTVYNLQVAGTHTYFVGKQGVWVHNRTTMQDIPTK